MFIEKDRIVENDSIHLSNIVGHDQGYGKMTWEYMLSNLKRIDRRYSELERTPEYFLRGHDYEAWSFINFEGAYFISSGKHRTTIARYLAHYNPEYFPENKIHGVTVVHYSVDKVAMDNYEDIRGLLKHPELDHLEFGIRTSWCMSESYFYLNNPKQKNDFEIRYQKSELETAIQLLQKRGLSQKLFGSPQSKYILRKGSILD